METTTLIPFRRYALFSSRDGAPLACSLPLPSFAFGDECQVRILPPQGTAQVRIVDAPIAGGTLPSYYEVALAH